VEGGVEVVDLHADMERCGEMGWFSRYWMRIWRDSGLLAEKQSRAPTLTAGQWKAVGESVKQISSQYINIQVSDFPVNSIEQ
jgi:hypothetical protein